MKAIAGLSRLTIALVFFLSVPSLCEAAAGGSGPPGNIGGSGNQSGQGSVVITAPVTTLPEGMAGETYSFQCTQVGADSAVTWSAMGLPAGLSISSDGLIGGVVAASQGGQVFTVTITAEENDVYQETDIEIVTMEVLEPVRISAISEPNTAYAEFPMSPFMVATEGGYPDLSFYSQNLPSWMELDSGTGVLTGTPEIADIATYNFTIEVADSWSPTPTTDLQVFSVTVEAAPLQIVSSDTAPAAEIGTAYSHAFLAAGGSGSNTWTFSGDLPDGLTGAPDGTLSGTPQAGSQGTYAFTVTVVDAVSDVASTTIGLFVAAEGSNPLTILTAHLPSGVEGEAYDPVLVSVSGGASDYSWTGIGLPAGLSMTSFGVISGKPEVGVAGTSFVELQVSDGISLATAIFPLVIVPGVETSDATIDNNTFATSAVLEGAAAAGCSLARASQPGVWLALLGGLLAVGVVASRRLKKP